jgi:hypothetical protein
MLMASPLIPKLNRLPPNRRRPRWGLLPGPAGAGFRSCTGAGMAHPKDYWKSLRPCPLRCPHHLRGDALANWHRFGVQSGGAPSGRSPSASVQLPRVPILAACARPLGPRQAGGSRTLRLTRAQPDTCLTKSQGNSKPPAEWHLIGCAAGGMVDATDREARHAHQPHAPSD